ncbi:hypothetical protein [Nesterenkonia sp.]|uniref:hypothetical protein n=1 Tax=Nesterenkonia sp. TaxID=704201 RepID=UPI002635433D|nr:hypothetical protein [Nesterenkonia sp.]
MKDSAHPSPPAAAASPEVLASGKDYRIEYHAPPAAAAPAYEGRVLVGFGEIGSGLQSPGFAQKIAADLGIAYIAVKQRHKTQYQFLSREIFQEAVAPWSASHELYLYGTSLGGYCAAYYARPVAAHFLALSPRIPAHPVTSRRLPIRFTSPGFLHEDIYDGGVPDVSSRKVVLLDPQNRVDRFYVDTDLAVAFDDLEIHHVMHAGHYVPRALLLSGCLKQTLTAFLRDETINLRIDTAAVLQWHEERFGLLVDQRRFGHAIEHLEVLLPEVSADRQAELIRTLNTAMRRAAARTS